jgi:cell division protease FtsH
MLQKAIQQRIPSFYRAASKHTVKRRCCALPYNNVHLPIEHVRQNSIDTHAFEKYLLPTSKTAPDIKSMYFEDMVENDKVASVVVHPNNNMLVYELKDGSAKEYHWEGTLKTSILQKLVEHAIAIRYNNGVDIAKYAKLSFEIALNLIYLCIGILLVYAFLNRGIGTGNPLSSSMKGPIKADEATVKFDDVAGLEGAKQEVMEIVEFLKNPQRFSKLGAKIPKGILLSGGPGLGKTLLAKAVAGEAGVPFFAVSASSFIELFSGLGSARIRSLFKSAKEQAPCIVFIDELDAIGRARSANGGFGGNDEREQTINQLLTEMDGFSDNNGVIVMSATNRPEILDPALVRPGRFDRLVALDPPTLKDREAILEIHTKNKPLESNVRLEDIAKITVGLSGAELANIANEAAIVAARRGAEQLSKNDFEVAIERILLGLEKKNVIVSDKKKRIVSTHEAGHAIVAIKVGEYDELSKISIVPRGKAGGVTIFEQSPENVESGLYSKQYLENRLAVALGGRAAEEIVFGEKNITTGAYSDMEVVAQLARSMVVNYGFSQKLGTVSWVSKNTTLSSEFSESTLTSIDAEVINLTKVAYERAKSIIVENYQLFNEITEQLYEKEVLDKKDIENILYKYWH